MRQNEKKIRFAPGLAALALAVLLTGCAGGADRNAAPSEAPQPETSTNTPAPPSEAPGDTAAPPAESQDDQTPEEILAEMEAAWPKDEDHAAFRVGDILVTLEGKEEGQDYVVTVYCWRADDNRSPFQDFPVKAQRGLLQFSNVTDANFDGHPDFGLMTSQGTSNAYWSYWIWDEISGLFLEVSSELIDPVFDAQAGTVVSYGHDSAATGVWRVYQWEDSELVLRRQITIDWVDGTNLETSALRLTVEGEDGAVLCTQEGEGEDLYAEAEKWLDLDYTGGE